MSHLSRRRDREFVALACAGWAVTTYEPAAVRAARALTARVAGALTRNRADGTGAAVVVSIGRGFRPFVVDCAACVMVDGPHRQDTAESIAGAHDDLHHGGSPTAVVRPDDLPVACGGAA